MKKKYDWTQIQHDYDSGMTWRDLQNKYQVAAASLHKATLRGDFKSRSHSDALKLHIKINGARKLSNETKQKISAIRIKYLQENPDKVPYVINHSCKESYPEKVFRIALESEGITGWQQNYRVGIYAFDFAFIDSKIDVEIDGGTHSLEKVKRIDERRDAWSSNQGWTVIRFPANRVKTDVAGCITELKEALEKY